MNENQTSLSTKNRNTSPRLITIPISHYCEKARWALDRAHLPYREERHLQIFHVLATYRAGRKDQVPILVLPDRVLTDSTDILKWVNEKMGEGNKLYPSDKIGEVAAFEDYLDEGFGVATRLWVYSHLIFDKKDVVVRYSKKHGVSKIQSLLFPYFYPVIKKLIIKALKVTVENGLEAKREIDDVFSIVGKRLESNGPFLFGDRFTAADLTFAALSAPLLLPAQYGVELPKIEELSAEMRKQVLLWREHPAGRFALKLFKDERMLQS